MNRKIIFIAGGGTGGHVYPGIAIANAIKGMDKTCEVHFVGTANGLETQIVPREGFTLHLLAAGKLNMPGQWLTKIKTLAKLPLGFLQAAILLVRYKPSFVLGVGGYASAPMVLVSSLLGYTTAIWEPNAHPGLANRWLSYFVKNCFIVFDEARSYLKSRNILKTGMPVRLQLSEGEARQDQKFHVLCFGGSQGARPINRVLASAIEQGGAWLTDCHIVHQIGSLDFEQFKKRYGATEQVSPLEFIFDMPKFYRWADIVICRGGASTLAEVAAFKVPPIIIPLPLADGHQEKNAQSFLAARAGVLILQKDLTPDRLIAEIERLKSQPDLRKQYSKNLGALFEAGAAERIAQQILA